MRYDDEPVAGENLPIRPGHVSPGRLERVLRDGLFAVTTEISPPDSADPQEVYERAKVFDDATDGLQTHRSRLDRVDLMKSVGLSEESIADPDARIPVAVMRRLWQAIIAQSDDEYLGVNIGRFVNARQMGLVGYAMYHSTNLYRALRNLSRFGRIVSEAVQITLDEAQDNVILRCFAPPYMIALRHPVDAMMSLVITVARELTATPLSPSRVGLPWRQPESASAYKSLYGVSVEFDGVAAEIEFGREQMTLPTQAPDATLSGYLTELAESKLAELGDRSPNLVDRVRRTIWASLPDEKPDLAKIASQMGMSARTLQRRLREFRIVCSAQRRLPGIVPLGYRAAIEGEVIVEILAKQKVATIRPTRIAHDPGILLADIGRRHPGFNAVLAGTHQLFEQLGAAGDAALGLAVNQHQPPAGHPPVVARQ